MRKIYNFVNCLDIGEPWLQNERKRKAEEEKRNKFIKYEYIIMNLIFLNVLK